MDSHTSSDEKTDGNHVPELSTYSTYGTRITPEDNNENNQKK